MPESNKSKMHPTAQKLRDFYAMKPGAPIIMDDFGWFTIDRWTREGHITCEQDIKDMFSFDPPGNFNLGNLGWCQAPFYPYYEEKIIEDRGEHELAQDKWGRHVLFFKNRRSGFMPEYVDHPVKDMKSWEVNCKWRMNPESDGRYEDLEEHMKNAVEAVDEGRMIILNMVGGYMYLRSLMGPLELLYKVYDEPELIRDCMETWFNVVDRVAATYQKYVTIDEIFLAEDICYNHGPLISPDMMREYLLPYYQQVIDNVKKRQLEKNRRLYLQVDTDGFCDPTIDIYREIGLDYMSPFEVASGCDVVRTGKEYPDLRLRGGFDKRIIASSKNDIDREIERIMPVMKARGGYIPMCDHGVPEEVSFENYTHFRNRLREYAD
jgi:uroporphyrinogen-III decarboxylase